MKGLFIIVVLICGPIALFNGIVSHTMDEGEMAILGLLFLGALGGAWKMWTDLRVSQAQGDYWLKQGKK